MLQRGHIWTSILVPHHSKDGDIKNTGDIPAFLFEKFNVAILRLIYGEICLKSLSVGIKSLDIDSILKRHLSTFYNMMQTQSTPLASALPKFWYIGDCLIERRIGYGGMGDVYRATRNEKVVAVKAMRENLLDDSKCRARFAREAALLESVDHPGVVKLLDSNEESIPHLVLGFVEGKVLSDLIGKVEVERAVKIFIKLCDALSAIHKRGIVHRDIKPLNVVVEGEDSPVLLDFGLAKVHDEAAASANFLLTERHMQPTTDDYLGTPRYGPPEFFNTPRIMDYRGDIYSLGVSLYEVLCGRVPFETPDILQMLALKRIGAPPPPSVFQEMPRRLEDAILKAIERDPDDRFQSAEEMKTALENALRPTWIERILRMLK